MRPLGISSPRDKIVQQAMRIAIEVVLEPKFSKYSHGFRPKRGCHSALREIREWKGVAWLLEGDIKAFFDSIDHHLLASLLERHFKEARLIHLYWKLVNAGYIEWDKKKRTFVSTDKGVPQGGIISPLLSNLVLHELDKYIEELVYRREQENLGKKLYITNPKYHALTMKIYRLRKKKTLSTSEQKILRGLGVERRKLKSIIPNPKVIRLKYVRYADDWIIGIWGSKQYARDLKEKIKLLLEGLRLELSLEKTLITNARSDRAKFLGVYIKRLASDAGSTLVKQIGAAKRRIPTGNLLMTAPIPEIVERLRSKEFLTIRNNRWAPKSIGNLVALPPKELILRYRTILNGFLNYYSFVDNRKQLNKIYWILWESLRKTLCRKHGIGKKAFLRKYGKDITLKIVKRNLEIVYLDFPSPNLEKAPMNFYGIAKFSDPLAAKDWKISTLSAIGQCCANCASEEKIEMHHVKHIKTINKKISYFDQKLARINRKQVPLCRPCHLQVHQGRYFGMSLSHFQYFKWTGEAKWS